MRLIDMDALMKYPIRINHYDKDNGNEDFVLGIESVLEYAENLPTIEAEPVKHGKWQEISSVRNIGKCNIPISKCSCCDFSFCDILNKNELYNFCPNCGARMYGKDDE